MYVYVQTEPQLWTVGHYSPGGKWHPETDHSSPAKAASRIHYLNGGNVSPLCAMCNEPADGPFYCYEHRG